MTALPAVLRHGFTLQGLAAGLGIFALACLADRPWGEAAMLGWCGHILTYAALLLRRLGHATPDVMRQRARMMTEGRGVVTALSVLASATSLMILVVQGATGQNSGLAGGAIAVVAILLSWFYVHLLFAQDYVHEYWIYEGGLLFPGGDGTPEFGEFLYFAFTIGMTFQLSDVTTNSPRMRRIVLRHALVAFAFNAVILAASVNIVAGLDRD